MSISIVESHFEVTVLRTWAQLLAEYEDSLEIAAIAVDCEITIEFVGDGQITNKSKITNNFHIQIGVPPASFGYVRNSDYIRKVMERGIVAILQGRNIPVYESSPDMFNTVNYTIRCDGDTSFSYVVKLLTVDDDWQSIVRELVTQGKQTRNQGRITEKVFARERQQDPLEYNEMLFGSQSEIRIAQEFENRKVMFFPLPLAVRSDTGNKFKDHREVDFLVCDNGVWGILEVSHHPNRFEQDSEKDTWFKESGILCIQHYTAERCYKNPSDVVDEFLSIVKKHKR